MTCRSRDSWLRSIDMFLQVPLSMQEYCKYVISELSWNLVNTDEWPTEALPVHPRGETVLLVSLSKWDKLCEFVETLPLIDQYQSSEWNHFVDQWSRKLRKGNFQGKMSYWISYKKYLKNRCVVFFKNYKKLI